MFHLQHTPGRTAIVEGKEFLFFSGYSYLGMQHVPEFVELVKEGIDKYGWLFPSSRISNTQLDLFEEFESRLSQITGQKRTVTYSSGYAAAAAAKEVINILCGNSFYNLSAPNSHPSISLFSHYVNEKNYNEWAARAVAFIRKTGYSYPFFIALNSVDPLNACINDFSFLTEIDKKVVCLIDDSHGIGLIGENGSGVRGLLPQKDNIEYVYVYSLSKALGLQGGAVSCSKLIAQKLRSEPKFTASGTIPPALAYAFMKGEHFYKEQERKLKRNIELFIAVTKNKFKQKDRLPIFLLPEEIDDVMMAKHNIIISSFAYPDPTGERINRIVLNALHSEEDLQHLANALP